MDDQLFQQKFSELLDKIQQLPNEHRPQIEDLAEQTRDRQDRIRASVNELQGSLDTLRLSVKYLVFDLEATRRENQYLRRLLDEATIDDGDDVDGDARAENDNFLDGEEI